MDIVYISVLGDLNGDGAITTADTSALSAYIGGSRRFELYQSLAASLTNNGAINALDLSAMSLVLQRGISAIENYYSYKG